ncbi:hypothetical protein SCALIN_C45_0128 [Candidatus Scalindua japonica]|uniref:WbqC-like protein n=1 Tax=Candidatus Scalindua japonica TaxID=1284222 RepID=A0A286U488_9BACT|nr:WbqC family protein [Candidatus Scalindua japonica]GAX62970.1 hypothetical protein SCALIN_C45_0128 [Candidatus Scalindua japonica]
MKLAIMQPYLFPYVGYFQLINAVDTFVIYDDVNYIKQGWINRNYILINGKKHLISLGVNGASSFKLINEIKIGTNRDKLVKTIFQSYIKAPYFEEVFPVIKESLLFQDDNLAKYITNNLKKIADILNIKTEFIVSSGLENDKNLKGQDKVLDICKMLKTSTYINATGGYELYSREKFKKNHIDLYFIKAKKITYKQFNNDFVPNLSIIDLLMFNSRSEVQRLLNEYELV